MSVSLASKHHRSNSTSSSTSLSSLQTIHSLNTLAHSLSQSVSNPPHSNEDDDNLKSLFETLALKERKVLEARELLDSAISELQSFKSLYTPVLGGDLDSNSITSTSNDYSLHSKTLSTSSTFSSIEYASSLATSPPISPQIAHSLFFEKSDSPISPTFLRNDSLYPTSPLVNSSTCFTQLSPTTSIFPTSSLLNRFSFRPSLPINTINPDLRVVAAYQASVREMTQKLEQSLATVDDEIEELEDQILCDKRTLLKQFDESGSDSADKFDTVIIKHKDSVQNEWKKSVLSDSSDSEEEEDDDEHEYHDDNTLKPRKKKNGHVQKDLFTIPKSNRARSLTVCTEYPIHHSNANEYDSSSESESETSSEESDGTFLSNFSTFFKSKFGITEEKPKRLKKASSLRSTRSLSPSKIKLTPMHGFKTKLIRHAPPSPASSHSPAQGQLLNNIPDFRPETMLVNIDEAIPKQTVSGGSLGVIEQVPPTKPRGHFRTRSASPKRIHDAPSASRKSTHSRTQSCTMPSSSSILRAKPASIVSPASYSHAKSKSVDRTHSQSHHQPHHHSNYQHQPSCHSPAKQVRCSNRSSTAHNYDVNSNCFLATASPLSMPVNDLFAESFRESMPRTPHTSRTPRTPRTPCTPCSHGSQSPGLSPTRKSRPNLHFSYSPRHEHDHELRYSPGSHDNGNMMNFDHNSNNHNHNNNYNHNHNNNISSNGNGSPRHQPHWQHHGTEALPLRLYDQYIKTHDQTHNEADELGSDKKETEDNPDYENGAPSNVHDSLNSGVHEYGKVEKGKDDKLQLDKEGLINIPVLLPPA